MRTRTVASAIRRVQWFRTAIVFSAVTKFLPHGSNCAEFDYIELGPIDLQSNRGSIPKMSSRAKCDLERSKNHMQASDRAFRRMNSKARNPKPRPQPSASPALL